MKTLFLVAGAVFMCAFTNWHYNLNDAKELAAKENKYVLLNFSGSDWCGPCIRMHKEIFNDTSFQQFANSALVMVNADFPRSKKNQLTKEQQASNNKMADEYNRQGAFPYTVLLNRSGKVIKEWDGYKKEDVASFIDDIKKATNANGRN